MTVFASFNYYASPLALLLAGTGAVAVLYALVVYGRSALGGVLVGGATWGAFAWIAFAAGSGDLANVLATAYGVVFGVIGAVLGGIAGAVGKTRAVRRGDVSGGSKRAASAAHQKDKREQG